jgi:hypothetical protein
VAGDVIEKEYLPYSDLDLVVYMVISLIRILEPNIPTPIMALDMYSLHNVVLSFSKDLLEAMIEICPLTCIPSRELSSSNP